MANLPNWACSIFSSPKWRALAGKASWPLRTFYIPEVGPGSEVKLTARYVPAGQLSVESENRRCSHPGFSAPACRTYDIKSIRLKTIDAYTCFVYPFVKSNIDARYTKCNLIATSMQYLELYEINAYHRLKLWHTSTGIDADASKGETSPGYLNSKLVYSYRCGTIFPWEFPEISLAYSHIFMKGPSRSIIYGQIFWHPHPHPHIASPAGIYHQNQLFFAFRFSFHLTIHFENAGNICNKIDL